MSKYSIHINSTLDSNLKLNSIILTSEIAEPTLNATDME